MWFIIRLTLLLCLSTFVYAQAARTTSVASATTLPAPESVLGFKPGTDRKLAKWESFVTYFRQLAEKSDRLKLEELGKTTLGRPFVMVTITAADNLQRLDEFKNIQRQLADPRKVTGDAAALLARGKTVVAITCSIHSTEVGGTFSCTELAHKLASDNSAETKSILDNTIILMIPSLNPDGTDIVAEWYFKTLGTPSEGAAPPELYHHYTGHDNNRDWYAFTQIETQLTVDKLLNVWHPQILHDIHQMGGNGARFFVPPYTEPWEPNIDPALTTGVNALGSHMAWELNTQGKRGVVLNGVYDAYSPARAYTHYHAGLRILSETASARLATPVNVLPAALRSGIGYDARERSWNYPAPWLGGRWTLRDIIDYQTAGAWALLKHAANNRELYLRNFYDIGQRAVAAQGMPYAILLPEPALPASLQDAVARMKTGVAQAQQSTGTDKEKHDKEEAVVGQISNEPSSSAEVSYYYKTEGLDRVLAILKRGGVEVQRASKPFMADGKSYPAGTHLISMKQPYAAFAKTLLEAQRYPDLLDGGVPRRPYDVTAHTLPLLMNVQAVFVRAPFEVEARPEPMSVVIQGRTRANSPLRLGLYKSYAAAMDEGWTRWVFDQYKFPYKSLLDGEIKQSNLNEKFDAILLPEQSRRELLEGLSATQYPAAYAGGLGTEGVKALRAFVAAGGTLIALNDACEFAVEQLQLPVRNVLQGVSNRDFYCPGSILRTEVSVEHPLAFGLEKESIAWFEQSPAFEITDATRAKAVITYPAHASSLLSGWILGEQRLRGKAALVEVTVGKGRVILFGFRPQYRGQSLATLPLLFNAILTSRQ
jgi:murein tripeptide amidase MpaA